MDSKEGIQFIDVEQARTAAFAYAEPVRRPYATSISELALDQARPVVVEQSHEAVVKAYVEYVEHIGKLTAHNRHEAIASDFTLAA